MEASVIAQDTSHTSPPKEALNNSPAPLVPPSLPPSHPPLRPSRPKPPPPAKSTQLPSRPPLGPSTPPCAPPPLISKRLNSPTLSNVALPTFFPPAGLPVPLSPTPVVSVQPLPKPLIDTEPSAPCAPLISPTTILSSSILPVSPSSHTPAKLSVLDQLKGSAPVWQTTGLGQDETTRILEDETPGAFLINRTESGDMMLLLRQSESECVRTLKVQHHKSSLYLDGSLLLFDNIFKLVSFYCISRDILDAPLRLPQAITTITKQEELEAISALGTDFWKSNLNRQSKNQDLNSFSMYLHVDPVLVDRTPNKDPVVPKKDTSLPADSLIQNGGSSEKKTPVVKSSNQETKFKRPPPRPPSLGTTSGMGLLFSEEVKVVEERENRKLASSSPSQSRPPVPPQTRSAPPLPPAPLRCTPSQKKVKDQEGPVAADRGKEQLTKAEEDPRETREGEKMKESNDVLNNSIKGEEETKDKKLKETEQDKEVREADTTESNSLKQPLVKRPTRPVPPPRRKPCPPETLTTPSQSVTHQQAVTKATPPRPPDVSLYSPEGGAVLDADPDSGTNSSTEEEGEVKHSCSSESRSPKVTVKRKPTTIILDRARHRLSTVLTGLISHERRLSQRLVELARDHSSYFGNLVKEHRAFTLESMSKHNTSTEMLQEIRQMMTQLKSYLLQSAELQGMLEPQHQYTQDKLESIVEAALCKSVLKPLRESIYQSLEKLYTDNGDLKQLAQNQSVVMSSTTTSLGISTAIPEASSMEKINIKLNNLHLEYSPQKKMELLLKACKIIYDSMSVSSPGRAHGADDLLPVMMYVLARSNLSALQLDVEYMMELMDPALTHGEGSYYLTTTYGALEHIKTFDQQRSATRQLSREIQDSIHRWERRRTLNQERVAQSSVQDFLTVCSPDIGSNPKTLGVLPTTTIQQLTEECAARFEQDSYVLSIYVDGVCQPLAQTDLALTVKSNCKRGAYCFVFHSADQPNQLSNQSFPSDPPPHPSDRPVQQSIHTRPSKVPPHPARRPSQQSTRSCPTAPPPHPTAPPSVPLIPSCPTAPPPHPNAPPSLPSIPSCPTAPPPHPNAPSILPSIASCPTEPPSHPTAPSSLPSIPSCPIALTPHPLSRSILPTLPSSPTDTPLLPVDQFSLESMTSCATDQSPKPAEKSSPQLIGSIPTEPASQSGIEPIASCPTDPSDHPPSVSFLQPTSTAGSTDLDEEEDNSLISF